MKYFGSTSSIISLPPSLLFLSPFSLKSKVMDKEEKKKERKEERESEGEKEDCTRDRILHLLNLCSLQSRHCWRIFFVAGEIGLTLVHNQVCPWNLRMTGEKGESWERKGMEGEDGRDRIGREKNNREIEREREKKWSDWHITCVTLNHRFLITFLFCPLFSFHFLFPLSLLFFLSVSLFLPSLSLLPLSFFSVSLIHALKMILTWIFWTGNFWYEKKYETRKKTITKSEKEDETGNEWNLSAVTCEEKIERRETEERERGWRNKEKEIERKREKWRKWESNKLNKHLVVHVSSFYQLSFSIETVSIIIFFFSIFYLSNFLVLFLSFSLSPSFKLFLAWFILYLFIYQTSIRSPPVWFTWWSFFLYFFLFSLFSFSFFLSSSLYLLHSLSHTFSGNFSNLVYSVQQKSTLKVSKVKRNEKLLFFFFHRSFFH